MSLKKHIKLRDCPFEWIVEEEAEEVLLILGSWHGHFSKAEYESLEKSLEDGALELQEKRRGKSVVAARLVQKRDEGEVLISEYGLLFSPFWKKKSYSMHSLSAAD